MATKTSKSPRHKVRPRRSSSGFGGLLLSVVGVAGVGWLLVQKFSKKPEPAAVVQIRGNDEVVSEARRERSRVRDFADQQAKGKTMSEQEKVTGERSGAGDVIPNSAEVVAQVAKEAPTSDEPMVATASLDFAATGAKAVAARQADEAALAAALTSDKRGEYVKLLRISLMGFLAKELGEGRLPPVLAKLESAPPAQLAMSRHAFLEKIGEKGWQFLAESQMHGMAQWIMNSAQAMEAVTQNLTERDNVSRFFEIWHDIWSEDPASRELYTSLAVAIALVFDTPGSSGELKKVDPFERFTWYIKNAEAGRLTGRIKSMKVADLVWVVCAPISQDELEWALKNVNFSQKQWGEAYSSIKYLMERAVKNTNPYTEYTLAEIKKKGGICADQTYYMVNTARAHGVPAAGISGDGDRGPHAWGAWLADDASWKFSGRFAGYPAGATGDPVTGLQASEEEFARRNERRAGTGSGVEKARSMLAVAAILDDDNEAMKNELVEAAVNEAKHWPYAWTARLAHWGQHRAEAPVEDWKTMIAQAKKEFRENSAMLAVVREAEERHVFPRQDQAATLAGLRKDKAKLKSNERKADNDAVETDTKQIALPYKRQGIELAKTKDYLKISEVYRKGLTDFGDNAAIFKVLAADYFKFVSEDREAAQKACRDMESAARRLVGKGSTDFFTVKSQCSVWDQLADCCQKAALQDKAERIRKDTAQLMKRASRDAL